MRTQLLATATALTLALAIPALAQTPSNPLPANPSDVTNGTPSAGTPSGLPPGQDPGTTSHLTPSSANAQPSEQPDRGASPTNGEGTTVSPAQTAPEAAPAPTAAAGPSDTNGAGADQSPQPAHKKWHRMHHAMAQGDTGDETGHWAHQPGTGESGPASAKASNIDSADTRSAIAPHLPTPAVGDNAGPDRYLHDAERALRNHRTGEAQQALEMAETRLLDRSTPAGSANQTDDSPRIQQVSSARRALASGDMAAATSAIQSALAGSAHAAE